jgi:hypothetical protein
MQGTFEPDGLQQLRFTCGSWFLTIISCCVRVVCVCFLTCYVAFYLLYFKLTFII